MRMSLSFVLPAALMTVSACASAQVNPTPPTLIAGQWRCNGLNPKDTFIPVVLEPDSKGACHARVVPPEGATGRPRVCTGNKAIWEVTNKCSAEVEVTFAFNPFTRETTGKVKPTRTKPFHSPTVRGNARETTGAAPAYKYDILLNGVIDLDPEIEIERRR